MFGMFESNEQKAEKWHIKAVDAFRGHDFINALDCFMKSVQFYDRNPVVWYEMSVLVGQHGNDWNKAKQCVERALAIDSENFPQAWKGLAIIEKQLGNTERAVELFKKLRSKYGWNPENDPSIKPQEREWLSEHGCL